VGFERITVNPDRMGGVPCIRRLRIPVATVVGLVAQGLIEARIVTEYPDLEVGDIHQTLAFAAAVVDERSCRCLPVLEEVLPALSMSKTGWRLRSGHPAGRSTTSSTRNSR